MLVTGSIFSLPALRERARIRHQTPLPDIPLDPPRRLDGPLLVIGSPLRTRILRTLSLFVASLVLCFGSMGSAFAYRAFPAAGILVGAMTIALLVVLFWNAYEPVSPIRFTGERITVRHRTLTLSGPLSCSFPDRTEARFAVRAKPPPAGPRNFVQRGFSRSESRKAARSASAIRMELETRTLRSEPAPVSL